MNKKIYAVAAALVLMTTASACGGSGTGSDSGVVRLTFRQFDEASQITGLVTAVDAWNAAHPDIQVKLETVTGNAAKEQYAREASTGSGPDVEQVAAAWVADLAKPEISRPLDDLIAATPPGKGMGDFLATDLAVVDGKTWALPWTVDTFALTYRRDILQANDIAVPTTWAELLDAARTIATKTGGKTAGFCFAAGSSPDAAQWFLINYYLWSNGGNLVEPGPDGSYVTGVDAATAEGAIDYFNSFFTSGATPKSMAGIQGFADPTIVDGLGSGTCAMSALPPQTFRAAEANADGNLLTAPMPAGSETRISHLGARMLIVNPNTEHADQAWQFIQYLISADTFKTYNQYPAQKSALDTLDAPASESGYIKALPDAVTFARYTKSGIPVTSMQKVVNQQFGAVYSGQQSPADAAAGLVTQFDDLTKK